MNLTELISSKVKKVGSIPIGVCISGGIDSTIILYHIIHDLMNGDGSKVYTFTVIFENDEDEKEKARKVVNHYGTYHVEVKIDKKDMVSMFHSALKYYPFPRFNLWTWIVVNSVMQMGLKHLFIGEGSDELVGYSDRSFLEGWAGQLVWVWPSWKLACDHYGIELHAPFKEIQDDHMVPITDFYTPPNKEFLRDIYQDILPDFVINQSSTPPSIGFYKMMGMTKEELQIEVCRIWLEIHEIHHRID